MVSVLSLGVICVRIRAVAEGLNMSVYVVASLERLLGALTSLETPCAQDLGSGAEYHAWPLPVPSARVSPSEQA